MRKHNWQYTGGYYKPLAELDCAADGKEYWKT